MLSRLRRLAGFPRHALALRSLSTSTVLSPQFAAAAAQYAEHGFAIIRGVLDPQLISEMVDHVAYLTKRFPGVPTEHLHHLILRGDAFWARVVSDPRLVDLAVGMAPFLGDNNVACFSSHYFHKPSKTGQRVLWHQDGSYWPLRPMNVRRFFFSCA